MNNPRALKWQELLDRPSLYKEEYVHICTLKEQNKRASIQNLYTQICNRSWRLWKFTHQQIKDMFDKYRDTNWEAIQNPFEYFTSKDGQFNFQKFLGAPFSFLYNHGFPYFISRANHSWTKEEDDFIIMAADKVTLNFSFLALCLPGRSGKEISSRFHELATKGCIKIHDEFSQVNPLKNYVRRYFLPQTEQKLAKELIQMYKKGIQINKLLVTQTAKDLYCSDDILAERATYNHFMNCGLNIYSDEENKQYTFSFQKIYHNIKNDLTQCETKEEHDDMVKSIIQDYNLPKPLFSHTWADAFLHRNRLSWRNAHYSRRGSVDPTYSKIYINQVANAVNTYGWDLTFNMDETCIRLNNSSRITLAPTGTKTIPIDKQRNDKEAVTAIGTITKNGAQKLIILSKGTDEKKARERFGKPKDMEIWCTNTESGWTNEEITIRYLKHVHKNLAKKHPCALIMDVYPAHRTKDVIRMAGLLQIELIYVPANGTGVFQPLDNKIYGILKSKLRAKANKTGVLAGPERWKNLASLLKDVWDEIDENHLRSAWDIPNLYKCVENYSKRKPGDNDAFILDDSEIIIDDGEEEEIIELYESDEEEKQDDLDFDPKEK